MRRFACTAALLVAALCVLPGTASAITAEAPDFQTTGPVETVFSWSANRCDHTHIGDLPQRAFRDYTARQQLMLAHASFKDNSGGTRRLTGSYIGSSIGQGLSVDCAPVFKSDLKDNPSSYNNYEWLAAPYTTDGQRVYSLTYDEFYPWETFDTADCTLPNGGANFDCLYTGLKLATSTNSGNSYSELPQPTHTIATLPYKYESQDLNEPDGHDGFRFGYYDPSNIFKGPDGAYYAMFPAAKFRAQLEGTCLMRTTDLSTPGSWRMYRDPDGSGPQAGNFLTPFVRPYPAEPPNPQDFTCTPVSHDQIGNMHGSVTYNRYLKAYMLVGEHWANNQPDIFYSTSKDLVNWTQAKKLVTANIIWENCTSGDEQPVLYASIVDNDSTTRNFETSDRDFSLYLTRYNAGVNGFSCQGGRWSTNADPGNQRPPGTFGGENRDVIRIPIHMNLKAEGERLATLENNAFGDPETGFDGGNGSGWLTVQSGGAYEGDKYLQATYFQTPPFGTLNIVWPNGTDVWYGAAFQLTSGFKGSHTDASILQWRNAGGTRYGGIAMGADKKWRMTRGTETLGQTFDLPEGQWFWIEVHQRASQANPLIEVFLNGKPVSTSTAPNTYPEGEAMPWRLDFGFPRITGSMDSIKVDRASISHAQRGQLGGPITPKGITGFEGDGYVGLTWRFQSDVPGGGYRVYKQAADGTWPMAYETSSVAYLQTGLVACTKHRYRVSAFKATGEESIQSEEIELMPRAAAACPGS